MPRSGIVAASGLWRSSKWALRLTQPSANIRRGVRPKSRYFIFCIAVSPLVHAGQRNLELVYPTGIARGNTAVLPCAAGNFGFLANKNSTPPKKFNAAKIKKALL